MGSESTAFGSQVSKTRRQPALCVCLRVRGRSGSQRACSKKSAVIYSVHAVPTSFNHHNLNIIQTVKGTYFLLKPRCAKWKCQSFSIYQSMTTCWEEKKKRNTWIASCEVGKLPFSTIKWHYNFKFPPFYPRGEK